MKGSRSVTITLSRVKARSIVDELIDIGLKSHTEEIQKSLRTIGEYRAEEGWVTYKNGKLGRSFRKPMIIDAKPEDKRK